jgi:hypothetical protein
MISYRINDAECKLPGTCPCSLGAQAMSYKVTERGDMGYSIVCIPHVHFRVALPSYIITFAPDGGKFTFPNLLKSTPKSAIVFLDE